MKLYKLFFFGDSSPEFPTLMAKKKTHPPLTDRSFDPSNQEELAKAKAMLKGKMLRQVGEMQLPSRFFFRPSIDFLT